MRQRDSHFALEVINGVEENDGQLTDQVKIRAAQIAYGNTSTDTSALAKAEDKLRKPEIRQALAGFIEERTAYKNRGGFTLEEGMQIWAKHIRGDFTKFVGTKDGVEEVAIPPNYSALKDYLKMVFPNDNPKQVQVQSISRVERINRTEQAPQIRARVIGETFEQPLEGEDDE